MSLNAKVVGYLGQKTNDRSELVDIVVLEIPVQRKYTGSPAPQGITIAHDYVRFHGNIGIEQQRDKNGNYPVKSESVANWIYASGSISIGIRDMYDLILPMLNRHKYLQPAHFALRECADGDYMPYAYASSIFKYYDSKADKYMISFRRRGEIARETLTLETFNIVKDTLLLYHSKKELLTK